MPRNNHSKRDVKFLICNGFAIQRRRMVAYNETQTMECRNKGLHSSERKKFQNISKRSGRFKMVGGSWMKNTF